MRQRVQREMSDLKQRVENFLELESSVIEAEEMLELGDEDEDIARELNDHRESRQSHRAT